MPFALQTGFESYVPKTRVLLWEAAIAAANGLGLENALASVTLDAAKLLGIDKRVGSLDPEKMRTWRCTMVTRSNTPATASV